MAFYIGQCMRKGRVKNDSKVAGWIKPLADSPLTNMAKTAGGGSNNDMSIGISYLEGHISKIHYFVEILINNSSLN